MLHQLIYLRREQGFVLVTALLMLLVLTVLGLLATNNTIIELQIAGNDRVHKQTFYQADAGTELAERLVWANSICSQVRNGFSDSNILGSIWAFDTVFADGNANIDISQPLSDANREITYYPGGLVGDPVNIAKSDVAPHTNFLTTFTVGSNPGSNLQMISGFEGQVGSNQKGATHRMYTVNSQHNGVANSQTTLQTRWRLDIFLLSNAALTDCAY